MPGQPLPLKGFHAGITLDAATRAYEEGGNDKIPVIRNVDQEEVQAHFQRIRDEVEDMVTKRHRQINASKDLKHFMVPKREGQKSRSAGSKPKKSRGSDLQ